MNEDADSSAPVDPSLSDEQLAVLALERIRWKYVGAKETEVLNRFGWTMTRYHQVLNALIDTPAALLHDPMTVRRLRRLREVRRYARRSVGERSIDNR